MTGPRLYGYVGPPAVLARIDAGSPGRALGCRADARQWIDEQGEPLPLTATFIVDIDGTLRVAPRRRTG